MARRMVEAARGVKVPFAVTEGRRYVTARSKLRVDACGNGTLTPPDALRAHGKHESRKSHCRIG